MKNLILSILFVLLCEQNSYAENQGKLILHENIGGYYYLSHSTYSGVVRGLDLYDYLLNPEVIYEDTAYYCSSIPGCCDLIWDARPTIDDNDFDIIEVRRKFYGIPPTLDTAICVQFSKNIDNSIPFGDLNVYLSCADLIWGKTVCLNYIKDKDEPTYLPACGLKDQYYDHDTYSRFFIHITPKELACSGDLNLDGIVNWEDFAIMAGNYGKPPGSYPGDFTGPEGLPDGVINNYDFGHFSTNWHRLCVDYNRDGLVSLIDYAVLANEWQRWHFYDYTGPDGFPDGFVDFYEFKVLQKARRAIRTR